MLLGPASPPAAGTRGLFFWGVPLARALAASGAGGAPPGAPPPPAIPDADLPAAAGSGCPSHVSSRGTTSAKLALMVSNESVQAAGRGKRRVSPSPFTFAATGLQPRPRPRPRP